MRSSIPHETASGSGETRAQFSTFKDIFLVPQIFVFYCYNLQSYIKCYYIEGLSGSYCKLNEQFSGARPSLIGELFETIKIRVD